MYVAICVGCPHFAQYCSIIILKSTSLSAFIIYKKCFKMAVDPKIETLERAFAKALQGLDQGVGDSEIQECFGDLKASLGAALQRSVMNMISRSAENMNKTFHQINEDFDLTNQINNYNIQLPLERKNADATLTEEEDTVAAQRRMKEIRIALKKAEIEELMKSMKALDVEIKKSKDQSGRLRTQLFNESDALGIENMKLKHASEALGLQ